MTTEKRSIDKDNLIFNVSAVVVDIEGTTTSINFVKETLFPYAREHLEEYINSKWSENEVQEDVALLREQAVKDAEDKVDGVVDIPEGDGDEVKTSVIKNVLWQMDNDRKTKALKQLQGHIWRNGYSSGKIIGHLYDDVKDCLKSWNDAGKKVYVYSSGSVEAQKLLFGNTKDGDLLPLFSGYFDTEIGPKTESASYVKIIESLKEKSHVTNGPKDVLFLTDVPKEAQAATEAGMQVAVVIREGNAPLPDDVKETFPTISSFSDLTFEGNAKRRKLSDKTENVKGGDEVVNDVEMEVCADDSSAVPDSVNTNNPVDSTEKLNSESKSDSEGTVKATPDSVNDSSKETPKTEPDVIKVNSEEAAKTSSTSVSVNSEETPKMSPDSVSGNSEETTKTIIDGVGVKAEETAETSPDSVNVNSEENVKSVPDNTSNSHNPAETIPDSESIPQKTKTVSETDEVKHSSENVTSSEDPKVENGLCAPEEKKATETLVKKDVESGDKVTDSECTSEEADKKGNSSAEVESMVVDGKEDINAPDSTVETDDVEMKEIDKKETENEKEDKTVEHIVEEKKSEEKTESCNQVEKSSEKEESEIKMEVSEKQDDATRTEGETKPVESSKENDAEMNKTAESESNCKMVTENQLESSEKGESKTEVSDVGKKSTVADGVKESSEAENSINPETESVMEEDASEKSAVDKKITDESTNVEETKVENNKELTQEKVDKCPSGDKEANGEILDEEESKSSSGVVDSTKNETVVNNEEETLVKEIENKPVEKEANDSHVDEKLVDGKTDGEPTVDDKTENKKADSDVAPEEHIEEPKSQVSNNDVETTEVNKETDDKKTDLNNLTPNGTHETCKNGVAEDETNNIPAENIMKEKIIEKVKESCTDQNGVETTGEV